MTMMDSAVMLECTKGDGRKKAAIYPPIMAWKKRLTSSSPFRKKSHCWLLASLLCLPHHVCPCDRPIKKMECVNGDGPPPPHAFMLCPSSSHLLTYCFSKRNCCHQGQDGWCLTVNRLQIKAAPRTANKREGKLSPKTCAQGYHCDCGQRGICSLTFSLSSITVNTFSLLSLHFCPSAT